MNVHARVFIDAVGVNGHIGAGMSSRAATDTEKTATDDHVVDRRVGFYRNGRDIITVVASRIVVGINRIRVVIVVNQTGKLVVGRVHEAGVHATVAEQSSDAHAPGLIIGGEITTDENFPVRLQGDGINGIH